MSLSDADEMLVRDKDKLTLKQLELLESIAESQKILARLARLWTTIAAISPLVYLLVRKYG